MSKEENNIKLNFDNNLRKYMKFSKEISGKHTINNSLANK